MPSLKRSRNIYRNIPNIITILRIAFGFMLILSLLKRNDTLFWLSLSAVIVSDGLDGFLARKLNLVSDLGKVLDHITDKLLALCVAFILCMHYALYWWVFYVMFVREILTSIFAIYIKYRRGRFPSSNPVGRIFGISSIITLIFYYYSHPLKEVVLFITLFAMLISSLANSKKIFQP